jgi:hypothetical protein
MAAMGASSFIPVIGPAVAFGSWATAGIYMVIDYWKVDAIQKTYKRLANRYEELQRLGWIMY